MITTANYLVRATVSGQEYFFEYDTPDMWTALDEFWHEDYPEVLISKKGSEQFPIDVYSMENGYVLDCYPLMFNAPVFHAFYDKGHTASGIYTLDQFDKDIRRDTKLDNNPCENEKDKAMKPLPLKPKNDVTSFFYYMWNAWCEEECKKAFSVRGNNWQHFWLKWCGICEKYSVFGAAERFYAELSNRNRDLLVKRATEVYEGDSEKH